jgi:chaperonin cofactor prefoldin
MMTAAVLSLIFGGAGAWAYERFLARPGGEAPAAGATAPQQGRDAVVRQDIDGLEDRIKDVSDQYNNRAGRYKELQERLEATPRSGPAPDLGPIERKVAQVDRIAQELDAIRKKVDPLTQKFEQEENRIANLDRKVDDLRNQGAIAGGRLPGGRDRQVTLTRADRDSASRGSDRTTAPDGDRPTTPTDEEQPAPGGGAKALSTPSADRGESPAPDFGNGVKLFNEKRYSEAYAAFRGLLQTQPDDARNWYYAALSFGLATGQWEHATKTMVEEGVAREKAGKPAKAEIDAAFAGLTKETGKDWLASFRGRAQ